MTAKYPLAKIRCAHSLLSGVFLMILGRLSTHQQRFLQSAVLAPVQSAEASVTDTVKLQGPQRHRDPREALSFLSNFDAQLKISKAMKNEKRSLMAKSSHAFFRASPALFYHDLKTTYKKASRLLNHPAPEVPVLGDAHALNAGTFRGPNGQTVWGLNDFDQTDLGSPEWDLERLGVSLYVASRSGGNSAEESMKLVEKMGRSYLSSLEEQGPSFLTREEANGQLLELMDKVEGKKQEDLLGKWTLPGGRGLKRNSKLVDPDKKRGRQVLAHLKETFPEYNFLDMASKPHSGGSTRGLERYYALVESPDRDEPWILETKAVLPTPVKMTTGHLNRGCGDKVLGHWQEMGGHVDDRHRSFKIRDVAFFTREREKEKGSLKDSVEHLDTSAINIGRVLARAHSKSGADIKGWIGYQEDKFLSKLVGFSRTYARQVESDYREFKKFYG